MKGMRRGPEKTPALRVIYWSPKCLIHFRISQ